MGLPTWCQMICIYFRFPLQAIPRQIAEKKEMMNEAISAGTTYYAVNVQKVIDHYQEVLAKPVEESIFYKPLQTKLSQVEGKCIYSSFSNYMQWFSLNIPRTT